MVLLVAMVLGVAGIFVGIQLSIQSSYYANPRQRLCGTLDRRAHDTQGNMSLRLGSDRIRG